MKKPRISIHYQRKRHLAGSPLSNSADSQPDSPASQRPEVSLAQIEREADMLMTIIGDHKAHRRISPREEYGLTRRDIAELLDDPRIAVALKKEEQRQYLQLAAGNITEEELGRKVMTDIPAPETALEEADEANWTRTYIEQLESRIIARAQLCGKRFTVKKRVETDNYDRTRGEDAAAQDRDVAKSGGRSIGGSIIAAEKGKRITTFNKGGKIRRVRSSSPSHDYTGGQVSEHDDYSEEGGA